MKQRTIARDDDAVSSTKYTGSSCRLEDLVRRTVRVEKEHLAVISAITFIIIHFPFKSKNE